VSKNWRHCYARLSLPFTSIQVVVIVNAQSARTVALLASDCDQWLASTESQWEHCCYRGGVGRSIWHVVDLVDVSMQGLRGRQTDSSTWCSMAWCAGMLSGSLATCPNMALRPQVIWSDTGVRPQSYGQNHAAWEIMHSAVHDHMTCVIIWGPRTKWSQHTASSSTLEELKSPRTISMSCGGIDWVAADSMG